MDNKWIFAVIGIVVGFYLCSKRNEKKLQDKVYEKHKEILNAVNGLLDQATEAGSSIDDIKVEFNRAMLAEN